MVEFLLEVLKLTLITALSLLGLGCIGYALGYGFFSGKADCDGNKYRLILPEINVYHRGVRDHDEETLL